MSCSVGQVVKAIGAPMKALCAGNNLHVNVWLQHVFQWEMEEYKKEGVKGKDIKFTDNRPLIDMFLEVRTCAHTLTHNVLKMLR